MILEPPPESSQTGPGVGEQKRIFRSLPITLLVIVAAIQVALVRGAGLSPWSGGGFGMFSTLDHGSRRHLHAFIVRPGLRREVLPPAALADEVKRALTLPIPH